MDTIHELYGAQDLRRLERKNKTGRLTAALLAGVALLGSVVLCCLTDTVNAADMEKRVIVLCTLAGWMDIYLLSNTVADARHELVHARMLMEEERTVLEGVLSVSKERMHIRGSIRFYPLELKGEETLHSKVIASRAAALRAVNGKRLRLYVVNGYAAAYELL